jgi:uncharacterized repeat protein (TIGR01451 family)
VESVSNFCYTFNTCWYDGAVQAYDAISQTIPTIVGHVYQISFLVADNSSCSTDGGGPSCNFSDLSTNGDTTDTQGNGINVTVYAQAGVPEATVTKQGDPMDQNGNGLTQALVESDVVGKRVEFDFDFSPAFHAENLTVQPGTTPFVGFFGISPTQYQALVAGTAMADTFCPTALGQTDTTGATQCVVNSLTATTDANHVPSGANLPTDNSPPNTRDILFTQVFDLDPTSLPNGGGQLLIPPHTAPGMAEFNDFGGCPFPVGDPLFGKPCPRSIMTSIQDGPTKPGGTPKPAGFGGIFFCCEPEWMTQPTIPLWTNNAASIPVSFLSTPPATPISDSGGFHAAQGLGVSFGSVARGVPLDPTFSYTTEQTALNPIACPASAAWSDQHPAGFTSTGTLTQFNNGGNGASFAEGPYDLLFAPLDCDEFLGLAYPASIDITNETPNPINLAQWNRAPFNVDTTNPTVGPITFSATGTTFQINQAVTASVTCTDPSSPTVSNFFSGIAKCGSQGSPQAFSGNLQTKTATGVPVPTNVAGPQTFTGFAQDAAGNSATQSVRYNVIYPSADTDLIEIGPLTIKSGTNATYNVAVWNKGPGQASNVVVTDTVQNGETVLSASYALVTCTIFGCPPPSPGTPCTLNNNNPGNTATCNIGGLPAIPNGARSLPGISVKVVAKVSASPGSIVKNTARVNASNPNPDNNTSFPWFTLVTR